MKHRVALLGCTGIVGQSFLHILSKHNQFEIAYLTASPLRNGKIYTDEVKWMLPFPVPKKLKNKEIRPLNIKLLKKENIKIIFSALPSKIAKTIEPELRNEGFYVFSNASAMRYEENVPILIPEVNRESIKLIKNQGFPESGFIITNANCSTTGLSLALAPLSKFDIEEISVSTYQSVSGAGYPGHSSMDILGNSIPFIKGEEKKMELEIKKILGIKAEIYPFCIRIPIMFGHLETVWIKFKKNVSKSEIINSWNNFTFYNTKTQTAPEKPVIYCNSNDSPQPKMSFWGNPEGMTVFTGRVKKLNNRIGFILLVNNIIRGAAGGSILNAETFLSLYRKKIG